MPTEIVVSQPTDLSPMEHLIVDAQQRGSSIEYMRELFSLKKEVEADNARKSFNEAFAAFKSETFIITKDKDNLQYKSKYTTIGNLVETVTPYLSKHGLSAHWDIEQSNPGTLSIKVTCTVSHSAGHSRSVDMVAPPDNSGAKNPIQQIKSTITYLRICTFEAVCGLASREGNLDDDGNGAGKQQGEKMPEEQLLDNLAAIESAADEDELKKAFNPAFKAAQALRDKEAMSNLTKARDRRKAAL